MYHLNSNFYQMCLQELPEGRQHVCARPTQGAQGVNQQGKS